MKTFDIHLRHDDLFKSDTETGKPMIFLSELSSSDRSLSLGRVGNSDCCLYCYATALPAESFQVCSSLHSVLVTAEEPSHKVWSYWSGASRKNFGRVCDRLRMP